MAGGGEGEGFARSEEVEGARVGVAVWLGEGVEVVALGAVVVEVVVAAVAVWSGGAAVQVAVVL